MPTANAQIVINLNVQKKGTPRKNPRNKGGSPRGVKSPPMLDTRKMKNMHKWTMCFLHLLILNRGLISTMLAPVVPIKLAKNAPIKSKSVLIFAAPFVPILITIPPEIIKREPSKIIKDTYSVMV